MRGRLLAALHDTRRDGPTVLGASGRPFSATMSCQPGEMLVGGGARLSSPDARLASSYPLTEGLGGTWVVTFYGDNGAPETQVYALCAS